MPRIVIADDEWVTRVEMEEMLTDLGYEVVGQAETGTDAIGMVRNLEPDLIIIDVMMPGEMNGIEAARVIKAEWGTPIIFVTGYGDPEYIEAAKEIAPFGYVMKPFDEKEVHAFVEIALSKRELEVKLMKAHEGLERANSILQEEIASRKKTEKDLRESEKLYRDFFEKNKAMKWVLDPATGKIIDANPAACEFYQYSYEEITNLRIWDINLLGEAEMKKFLASAESDEQTEYTFRHRLASGEIRTVQVYTGTVVSGGKKLLHSIIVDITDRQRAEEALRESEERYRRLTENAKDMIYRMSLPDGIYEYVSPASIDLTGYTPEEFYESPMLIQKYIHPDWVEYLQEQWTNLVDGKVAPFYEYQIVHKSGDKRWVNQRNVLILDNNGQPQAIEGIATDVTDQKEAEEALRESEERYRILVENAGEAIFVAQEGMLKFVNKKTEELSGRTQKELLSTTFDNFIHPDDRAFVLELHVKRQQGIAVPSSYSFRLIDKSGEVKWVESDAVEIDWEDRFATLNFLRNITDRKRADEALRESEEKHRLLFESAGDAIFILDTKGHILTVNSMACEMLGYTREELMSMTLNQLNTREEAKRAPDRIARLMAHGHLKFETVHQHKNGSPIPIEVSARLITWEGQPAIMGICRDITARKTGEKEREKLRDQLTQAQKMEAIGTLAAGVAHDFNNILAIILGNTELNMADIPGSNLARQRLDDVRKACLRAKDVIRQILSFSRKSKTELRTLNIATVVTESLKFLRASIPTSIDIRQNIPNDTFHIVGDPTQIHQVMINLCINAAHAMEDKEGILEVAVGNTEIDKDTASKDPALHPGFYVQLSVSDTGNGISPDVIDRVFDPYFTTKDVAEGTGLGLSVVHGIVKGHHGRISVKSKPGKGTIFKILFPAIKEKTEGEQKESQKLPTGKESILFVDDEESIVKVNQQLLEGLGYRVTWKTDPSEALEFFRANSHQIDLIITDMTMPKMTGDKLARAILEIRSDMPIILCTGYNEKLSEDSAQELGIRKYVEKPIEKEILARSVREVLDGQQDRITSTS